MGLPSRVGDKFNEFGTLLLKDDLGSEMPAITEDCRGMSERITIEVLRRWLVGKGIEISWESLISTLKKIKLSLMAEQMQTALDTMHS